jgi:hypothetical protein
MTILQRVASPSLAACVAITAGAVAVASAPIPAQSAPARDAASVTQPSVTQPSVGQPSVGPTSGKPIPPDLRAAVRPNKYCESRRPRATCRRYAGLYRTFGRGHRPTGVGGTFSVHKPGDLRRGEHSLAEISLHMPGAWGNIIEVGWRRYLGRTRLFVFRWNHNNPACYDRCGFQPRGLGKKPGSRLRPGSYVRFEWRHHHHRWNLYVNGRWSGFYPDRLWNGNFRRVGTTQLFGEVTFRRNGVGRCIDMGNGKRPRYRSARVFKIQYVRTNAGYRAGQRQVTAPRLYNFTRPTPRSFKYGGPGPC